MAAEKNRAMAMERNPAVGIRAGGAPVPLGVRQNRAGIGMSRRAG
jgi:hypothetical protein